MNLAPHPFTLRQLQYVVAVADLLSFRKAAEHCHVSQPALSAQVSQLEDMLGLSLFERDRRRVLPTPAGAAMIASMRRLLVDADALLDASRRAGDPFTGTLRLGVIPTISPYLLPRLTPAFRHRFPKLTTIWTEEKTPVLMARLGAGTLDAAVLALEAELGDVEHEVVARDPFVLATPSGHALAHGRKPVRESELAGESVLLLDEGHCFRTQALAFCSRAEAHEMSFRATSLGTLAQMVAGGAGVTLLPKLAVPTEARRAELALRELAAPAPFRTIALVWRPRSPLADALRQLGRAMHDAALEGDETG
ncbi:LysR substrate-binding domain-containing protein [Myxococcota bacterium]|nr:LysR substrate-binding domain-containing protein [Myxococcota bacterium]